jgi:hypothetical protein
MEGDLLAGRPAAAARTALHVHDLGRRLVEDPPPGAPEAEAPIEDLHVEPVALVEKPDLPQRLGPDHHEGAVHGVHLAGLVLAEMGRAVLAEA